MFLSCFLSQKLAYFTELDLLLSSPLPNIYSKYYSDVFILAVQNSSVWSSHYII